MKALLAEDADLDFRYWGGDRMTAQGGASVKHIRELAFMGFIEVLMNLRTILRNIDFCKQDIAAFQPDALVLIDYPGFNLRIAEWAKQQGIPVHYYISPQVWAWKESRVKKIKAFVDQMYVILPFEQDFYAKHNMQVQFVGHPLIDAIEQFRTHENDTISSFKERYGIRKDKKIIALLPGSRTQEIKKKLPLMLEAAKAFQENYQLVIAGAPTKDQAFYQQFDKNCVISENETYALLSNASFAIVTSGTATLETALFKVPEVVCYKGSTISYWIARSLVKIKYISLVNLIMDREVVKELIQNDCTVENIRTELKKLIDNEKAQSDMQADFSELISVLGEGGASQKVARYLLKSI